MREKSIVKALSIMSLGRGISVSILRVFLPVYAVSIGLSIFDIGLATSIATLVSVVTMPFIGYFVDVYGRRLMIVLSNACTALAGIVAILFPSSWGVLSAYVLFYLSFFSWQPTRASIIVDVTEEGGRGTIFALLSLVFQVSRTITPYIAGLLIVMYGYSGVFVFSSIMLVIVTFVFMILVRGKYVETRRKGSLRDFINSIIPHRNEISLHVILSIDRFGWSLWLPLLNSILKVHLGFDEGLVGFMNTLMSISTLVTLPLAGKFVDKRGWRYSLLLSELLGALGVMMIVIMPTILGVGTAMIFLGTSIAFWIPSFNVAIPSIIRNKLELGRAYSRANMYRTAASIPSPALGGTLYQATPILPLIVGIIILLTSSSMIAYLGRKLEDIK